MLTSIKNALLPERDEFGVLHGNNYAPYITVLEASGGRGKRQRVESSLTGRTHHYLSALEAGLHMVSEMQRGVVDIREQYFVFDMDYSLAMAKTLGVPHPKKDGQPFPVTIDLVLTIACDVSGLRHVARSVKSSEELSDPKVLARQTLEKAICDDRGWSWKLVTELEITPKIIKHAGWIMGWQKDNPGFHPSEEYKHQFLLALSRQQFHRPLRAVLTEVAHVCEVEVDAAILMFKYLVTRQLLRVDFDYPVALSSDHAPLSANFL